MRLGEEGGGGEGRRAGWGGAGVEWYGGEWHGGDWYGGGMAWHRHLGQDHRNYGNHRVVTIRHRRVVTTTIGLQR